MKPSRTRSFRVALFLLLIMIGVAASSIAYYWIQTALKAAPKTETLTVEGLRIDKKRSILIGVDVKNLAATRASIARVILVKVQVGLVVYSTTLSPAVDVESGGLKTITLSFRLDPEGADYELRLITVEGAYASYVFGYP